MSHGGHDLAHRMLNKRMLSEEEEWNLKYLYAIGASAQPRRRHFANIYDLVLYGLLNGFERAGSSWIFRGQFDAGFNLLPSFFRTRQELLSPESALVTDHVGRVLHSLVDEKRPYEAPFALDERMHAAWRVERKRKLEFIRQLPGFSIVDSLSEFEQDVVIQHYSSGTPFLDFTESICVAAFFATRRVNLPGQIKPAKGAIYVVAPHDLQNNLALGRVVVIRLPHYFERPNRQKAVFVLTAWPELLRDRSLFDVWTFCHTPVGLDFECFEYGVSGELLLPDPKSPAT